MQSSESSNSPNKRVSTIVWTCRIVLGGVLVFSGLAKAIDPWGGLYKIADYLTAWGMSPYHEISLALAALLATFEFGLGAMIVLGCYRKATRWLALAFMGFMTILSLYIWIADPVEDCGCFGEALIISNGATFLKNIVLMVPALILFRTNSAVPPLIRPTLQWIALLATFSYISIIQIIGYHIQPLVDFRPYPVGTDLASKVSMVDTPEMDFVYEKNGQRQTFDTDNLPDESWTFVERIEHKNDNAPKSELAFFDSVGDDVTHEIISNEGDEFILIVTDPANHGISRSEMANRLSEYCDVNDATMVAAVALPSDSLDAWTYRTEATYDVYSAEDTDLKILARGEAAVVMLRDGVIQWKRNIYSLAPNFPNGEETPDSLIADEDSQTLMKLTFIWLTILALTIIIPRIAGHLRPDQKRPETPSPIENEEKQ